MKAKKVLAIILAGVLSASVLTGCGGIDQNAVISEVGDAKVSMGLANFYCRLQQATYEDIYKMYLGTDDVWTVDPYGVGVNMQDSVKESALEELHDMYTLQAHMGDYGIALTEEDKSAITAAAEKFMSDNSAEAIKELGASQEIVEEFLTLCTIRARMQDAIKAETDANVSNEEANMRGYTRLIVNIQTEDGADDTDAAATAAARQTAEQIETELGAEGATLESVAEAHELETTKQTYATYESKDDTEDEEDEEDDAVMKALKGLKEGETSGPIEMENGFYFVRVDSDTDTEATESNRQSIITTRQNEHYTEVLEGWQTDDGWEIDMSLFGKIQFDTPLTSTDPNATEAGQDSESAE